MVNWHRPRAADPRAVFLEKGIPLMMTFSILSHGTITTVSYLRLDQAFNLDATVRYYSDSLWSFVEILAVIENTWLHRAVRNLIRDTSDHRS